jgi:putative tryptophan/tyrosine transport system substrate-binding protein
VSLSRALFIIALSLVSGVIAFDSAIQAAAEQKVVRLGFVAAGSPSAPSARFAEFWNHLHELGWVEGQNLVVERRWAVRHDQLPGLMREVVASKVDIIVTFGTPAGIAAKQATDTVPIVDAVMGDPLRTGLVASLARPGGNLTGLSLGWAQGLPGKWLELLQETLPRLSTVAVIANLDNPNEQALVNELHTAASTLRLKLRIIDVREPAAFERALEQAQRQAQALLILADPANKGPFSQVVALVATHRLPAIYVLRDFADAGGLMALGPDLAPLFRRAAEYVDKILRGAQPADLPVEQSSQYVLVVNLKAAQALRLTIPQSILLRADEVIR